MKPRPGIFPTERRAWLAVVCYIVLLYSTLTVAFDLYVSVYDQIGKATVSLWMNGAIAGVALVLSAFFLGRVRPPASGYAALLLIGLALAFTLSQLPVPAKRFHFFQYAPLTVLIFDALRFRCRSGPHYIWTMVLVTLTGLGDETIQGLLPSRHFGLLDLVINSTAGLLTLLFIGLVLQDRNYPWGRR